MRTYRVRRRGSGDLQRSGSDGCCDEALGNANWPEGLLEEGFKAIDKLLWASVETISACNYSGSWPRSIDQLYMLIMSFYPKR